MAILCTYNLQGSSNNVETNNNKKKEFLELIKVEHGLKCIITSKLLHRNQPFIWFKKFKQSGCSTENYQKRQLALVFEVIPHLCRIT